MTEKKNDKKPQKTKGKVENLAVVKAMSTEGDWNKVQELLQEVMATYVIKDPDKKLPAVRVLKEDLEAEIKARYKDEKEILAALLEAVPSIVTIGKWIKKPKWNEAVWSTVRDDGLFTKEKRAKMIDALFKRGVDKSDNAAKIYLTLSGDYSDKLDIGGDKTVEKFREINAILHKKKQSEE